MNELVNTVKTFDSIKHTDENGKEYWNTHELSKALGYAQYQKFKPAIERAKTQMKSNGINPKDHMSQVGHMVKVGSGAEREIQSLNIDRRAAYTIAMNADPSKPQVAIGQEYFLQNTATVEAIEKRMKDAAVLESRNMLRIANKNLNDNILARDVEPEEIGIVLDAGDQGFFGMKSKEVKELNNIPHNRPIADYMPNDVMVYKAFAQVNSEREIEKHNLRGVKNISEAVNDENSKAREMYINKFDKTPESSMPAEDVKKIERRYNKQTQKYLDALNYES